MDKKKNVVVIDDLGDLLHILTLSFIDNPTVQLIQTSSDIEDVNKTLGLENYFIIVNEEGLKNDITQRHPKGYRARPSWSSSGQHHRFHRVKPQSECVVGPAGQQCHRPEDTRLQGR